MRTLCQRNLRKLIEVWYTEKVHPTKCAGKEILLSVPSQIKKQNIIRLEFIPRAGIVGLWKGMWVIKL